MKILGILFIVFMFIIFVNVLTKPNKAPAEAAPPDPESDAAIISVMAVKKTQRNPASFVLEEALVMEKAVCLTWRGENGFGGMNRGRSVTARDLKYAFNDHESGFTRAWNRDCANKQGRNLTTEMQGQLRHNSRFFE